MDDETPETPETPPPAPPVEMARIQCITDLRPWAQVGGGDARPLDVDEVAMVPRDAALDTMKRRRHIVEIR